MTPHGRRIVALMPLRAAAASSDWARVSALCRDAVRSVLVADVDTRLVLACTDVPDGLAASDRLLIERVDGPVPATHAAAMADKGAKLAAALRRAAPLLPAVLFKIDADDLVSARFLAFLSRGTSEDHVIVADGYVWPFGASYVLRQREFWRLCGTSYAAYLRGDEGPLETTAAGTGLLSSHAEAPAILRARGAPFGAAPFPAVIYRRNTGDNASGPWRLRSSVRATARNLATVRPLTAAVRREFGSPACR